MNEFPHRYTAELANQIEHRWQETWDSEGTYHTPNPVGELAGGPHASRAALPKRFILDMFPYPSGAGLHVGHPLGYMATDVYARYCRMRGENVLHTMGYDAFGLPTEQYAIQTGQAPEVTTEQNIATMSAQLRRLGLGHDPRRSVRTTDPEYYAWTQWIFVQLFNSWYDPAATRPDGQQGCARPIDELAASFADGSREVPGGKTWGELTSHERDAVLNQFRLAYRSEAPVNWCPGLGTVLANEEVTSEGRSERGNYPVFKRHLAQWMMRITEYAPRLLDDLEPLEWPEPVKLMQRNWIGRSQGAAVRFELGLPAAEGQSASSLEVFTTRPDTLAGVTFMVLAPEHPLVSALAEHGSWDGATPEAWKFGAATPVEGIAAYQEVAGRKGDEERTGDAGAKTGVFTGVWATNPLTGSPIPVFLSDYVLMGYGTGAIMAVPAEDSRDHAFATLMALPIVRTVQPPVDHPEDQPYEGDGVCINSNHQGLQIDGLQKAEAIAAVTAWLEQHRIGEATTTYRLRDWLFSRQRYWGEPFPIVYDQEGRAHALPSSMLPVELPEVDDYAPEALDPDDASSDPRPPLARAEEWVKVTLDLGDGPHEYRRETNTMPNWAGSCWYYLRYLDPTNSDAPVNPALDRYWMAGDKGEAGGVDLYVGGVEHAVLHLLYARFWHKVLFDLGVVSTREPFTTLFNQGYIQAYAYRDHRGQPVPAAEVTEEPYPDKPGQTRFLWEGQEVKREYGKMGKSLKNVTTPDDVCRDYGADTFRVYEMSMGPLDASKPWETRAIVGAERFLQRLWRNIIDETTGEVTVADTPFPEDTTRLLHKTIAAVSDDYAHLRFNTAIAKLIELNNALTPCTTVTPEAASALVRMVAPVAPHLAEELWSRLGNPGSVVYASFPEADESLLADDVVTCVVQINGKVRHRVEVSASVSEDDLLAAVRAEPKVEQLVGDKTVRKAIVRPPALVNLVV